MTQHPYHHSEIKKLNRISGQIDGIKKMIESGRYCPEILTQLRAVRAAVKSVELNILETHIEHCVTDVIKNGKKEQTNKKILELKNIIKRFN